MACEAFIERKFSSDTLATIEAANTIIAEYQADGFTLTLRQLYYQFVARDMLKNRQSEYKRLGAILNDARLAGLVDWAAIEDRTRSLRDVSTWDAPGNIIKSAAHSYKEDLWAKQPVRVEVWIEKDALLGVIEPACERWRLPYFACRGNNSQSEQYVAGKRILARMRHEGKRTVILHLGDHDPNGLDMTRDNDARLQIFTAGESDEGCVDVRRLALNYDQVVEHRPPPNPVKMTDSRSTGYVERFGEECWELDALSPQIIDGVIDAAVRSLVDMRAFVKSQDHERVQRATLETAADRWDEVAEYLS